MGALIRMRIENRKARYNFFIFEKYEAGIALEGPEVKSIREGKASLAESFCKVEKRGIFIHDMHISPYEKSSPALMHKCGIEPKRKRRLLLHKNEIKKLYTKQHERGFTIVPLCLYFNQGGIAKIEIAVSRGKRKYEKREAIKERELKRELRIEN